MTLRADIASVATLRITKTQHLLDCLLYKGPLIGWNLFPAVIPPTLPVVNEDLAESVTTVLRRGMKQQESHFFACGNGKHLLTGVNETAIIADRVFGLLSMIHDSDRLGQEYWSLFEEGWAQQTGSADD